MSTQHIEGTTQLEVSLLRELIDQKIQTEKNPLLKQQSLQRQNSEILSFQVSENKDQEELNSPSPKRQNQHLSSDKNQDLPKSYQLCLGSQQLKIKKFKQIDAQKSKITLNKIIYRSPKQQAESLLKFAALPSSIEYYQKNYKSLFDNSESSAAIVLHFDVDTSLYENDNYNHDNNSAIIVIDYQIDQPIAGLKFQKVKKQDRVSVFCNTSYYPKCSFNWVPTVSYRVFIPQAKFIIRENNSVFLNNENIQKQQCQFYNEHFYQVLCTGNLKEEIVDQSDDKIRCFVYEIQKNIQMDFIGFAVGKFHHSQRKVNFTKINLGSTTQNNENLNFIHFFSETTTSTQEKLQNTSSNSLFQDIVNYLDKQYINDQNKNTSLKNYKIVFLPNLLLSEQQEFSLPQSFCNICFLDENLQFPDLKLLHEQFVQRGRDIFKNIHFSVLIEKINIGNQFGKDFWILTGVNDFISDYYRKSLTGEKEFKIYLNYLFEKLNSKITRGDEQAPLSTPDESVQLQGNEKFHDETFLLKSRLCFHLLSSIVKKYELFFKNLLINLDNQLLTTKSFQKMIKSHFGFKNIKIFFKQFIKSTGIPHLLISFDDSRQENRVNIHIEQSALQENVYKFYNENRMHLEEKLNCCGQIYHLHQHVIQVKKQQKEQQNQSDSDSMQQEDFSTIQQGKLVVPQLLKSIRLFSGRIMVNVTETNEQEIQSEPHYIKLLDKSDFKYPVNYRSRFRKNVGRKLQDQDEADENQDANNDKKLKKIKDINQRMWLKIDNEKETLCSYNYKQLNEYALMKQLGIEENIYSFFIVVKNIKERYEKLIKKKSIENNGLQHKYILDCLKQIRTLLEKKTDFIISEVYVTIELIRLIAHLTKFLDVSLMNTVLSLQRLLKANIYDKETQSMIKENDFQQKNEYLVNLAIIKVLPSILDQKEVNNQFQNSKTIEILLQMLIHNDNSKNQYEDSHYRATIINSLLLTFNPFFKVQILTEVIRQLELEFLEPSDQFIVIRTIQKQLTVFMKNNHINFQQINQSNSQKIAKNEPNFYEDIEQIAKNEPNFYEDIEQNEVLGLIFKKVREFHRGFQTMELKVQKFEQSIQQNDIQKNKFSPNSLNRAKQIKALLFSALEFLEKYKNKIFKQNIYEANLSVLSEYVSSNHEDFSKTIQFLLSEEENQQIAEILWEQLTQGSSLINPVIRLKWLTIYKVFYFYWQPLCIIKQHGLQHMQEQNNFIYDPNWGQTIRVKQIKKNNDQLKFNHLKFKKRKRSKAMASDLNTREELNKFCQKHPDKINWKDMSRHIVCFVMKEKITELVEKKMNTQLEEQENQNKNDNKIKLSSQKNLKDIKKKLSREQSYLNHNQVKEEMLETINYFSNKREISNQEHEEYCKLIESFFFDLEQIIKENKDQSRMIKVKNFSNIPTNSSIITAKKSQISSFSNDYKDYQNTNSNVLSFKLPNINRNKIMLFPHKSHNNNNLQDKNRN